MEYWIRRRAILRKSGVKREDIFLTSKVWIEHYGYEAAKASVLESSMVNRVKNKERLKKELNNENT